MQYITIKRGIDVAISSLGLIILSPLLITVAIAVRFKLGKPILFTQDRPGIDGKIFKLFKFRTMAIADSARGLLSDEERLTPFGRLLRSSSLDELPSLVNVLAGDMSIVGPRPLLPAYLIRYSEEQARRHNVRPGITGLAQVRGRNSLSWEEKFKLDVKYVEQISFRLDFSILLQTIASVLQRKGITAEGHATNFEFIGSAPSDGVIF